jgi:class 3 adenylate cyclase
VVVIDPQAPVLANGTGAFAANWVKQGRALERIDLAALRSGEPAAGGRKSVRKRTARPRVREERRQIKSMLFADVKNFSKLPEALAPLFFVTFLAEVDKAIKKSPRRPVFQNTWGDGLYLVFNQVTDCAAFALSLLDRMRKVDWGKLGLPTDTAVRIGLHSGPVYRGRDPIIGRNNFFGSHVTRAARIEPVTPPGCAFASEQFAAALAAVTGHHFVCDYVGRQTLAKNADHCILYRLRRR